MNITNILTIAKVLKKKKKGQEKKECWLAELSRPCSHEKLLGCWNTVDHMHLKEDYLILFQWIHAVDLIGLSRESACNLHILSGYLLELTWYDNYGPNIKHVPWYRRSDVVFIVYWKPSCRNLVFGRNSCRNLSASRVAIPDLAQ